MIHWRHVKGKSLWLKKKNKSEKSLRYFITACSARRSNAWRVVLGNCKTSAALLRAFFFVFFFLYVLRFSRPFMTYGHLFEKKKENIGVTWCHRATPRTSARPGVWCVSHREIPHAAAAALRHNGYSCAHSSPLMLLSHAAQTREHGN